MMCDYTFTGTISISSFYDPDKLKIPEGYIVAEDGFRPPVAGEVFLKIGGVGIATAVENFDKFQPRIILKPKPNIFTMYPKGYTVPYGYKILGFRPPFEGELLIVPSMSHNTEYGVIKCECNYAEDSPRIILEAA